MAPEDFKRKLTAIFSADVAGYSRLMGEDEAATVKLLESYKQVIFSLIRQHRGRVIDSPGDNLLAEFASVVDAVQCGVAIQNELKARNEELPENRRMQFRIGVNLGDVIEEGDRIYGDGVNIAARLEALADPGGICVSKTAFDYIESKLPLDYALRFTPEANDMARKLAEELIDREPDWGEGYYILSEVHMMDVWLGMTKSPKDSLDKAIALSEKAVSLDDSLSQAFAHIGYLYALKKGYGKSIAYAEEAVQKNPNGADAHAWLGNCLRFVSRVQEAITHYEKAMRLNPCPPQWYYINLGIGYNQMGRYQEGVAQINKALALRPNSVSALSALVVAYGIMGKEAEARTAAEELLRVNPNFSAEKYVKTMPYKDPVYPRQAAEALRKAGLQ